MPAVERRFAASLACSHGVDLPLIEGQCTPLVCGAVPSAEGTRYSRNVLSAAKGKGSKHATALYLRCMKQRSMTLDLCGLDLDAVPPCAVAAWLQRVAASCNHLSEFPVIKAPALFRLNLAHNKVARLPESIASYLPNVKVSRFPICPGGDSKALPMGGSPFEVLFLMICRTWI